MEQLKKRSKYEETNVKFDILGKPKRSSNAAYIPKDEEYNALTAVFPWLIEVGKRVRTDRAVERFI